MLKVMLLAHTPAPEQVVAAAAKTCYSSDSLGELFENMDDVTATDYVDMLAQIGHESPIEHASFTFGVEGVSRSLLAQLTRHRIASFSVRSQRYVSERRFDYVVPPEIAAVPEALTLFEELMERDQEVYNKLCRLLTDRYAAELTAREPDALSPENPEAKQTRLKLRRRAQEDARYVLPNACDTQLIMTMNARELRHFFRIRCCMRAQWEIRAMAEEMLRLARGVSPALFAASGPPCVCGPCPEGKMSCGRAAQIREKFKNL